MLISSFLPPDAVAIDLRPDCKRALLADLAARAAPATGHAAADILNTLTARERLGSTGMGAGVAIPHGRLPGLERLHGAFVQLAAPVDYDALDDLPVDLVFLLLAPTDAGSDHLRALAAVSRLLRGGALRERLRAARSAEETHALLTGSTISSGARAA